MLRTFCEQTSFHGWNLIALSQFKPGHVVFWLLVIISSFVGLSFMVYNNAIDFSKAKVAFHIESPTETLNDVHFPAIYLINKNLIRKSLTQRFANETKLTVDLIYKRMKSWFVDGGSSDMDVLSK